MTAAFPRAAKISAPDSQSSALLAETTILAPGERRQGDLAREGPWPPMRFAHDVHGRVGGHGERIGGQLAAGMSTPRALPGLRTATPV